MFGNRVAQVKFVKEAVSNSDGPIVTPDPMLGPEIVSAYAEIAKDLITHAAVTIGITYSVCKIIGRLCK